MYLSFRSPKREGDRKTARDEGREQEAAAKSTREYEVDQVAWERLSPELKSLIRRKRVESQAEAAALSGGKEGARKGALKAQSRPKGETAPPEPTSRGHSDPLTRADPRREADQFRNQDKKWWGELYAWAKQEKDGEAAVVFNEEQLKGPVAFQAAVCGMNADTQRSILLFAGIALVPRSGQG